MTTHTMELYGEYFKMVKSGVKPLEIRRMDEKRKKIKVGDVLRFKLSGGEESFDRKVKTVQIFETFEETFKNVDFRKALPGCPSVKEAINAYLGFPGYKAWNDDPEKKIVVFGI